MESVGCLSLAQGNCIKTVQDKEELGGGCGEKYRRKVTDI